MFLKNIKCFSKISNTWAKRGQISTIGGCGMLRYGFEILWASLGLELHVCRKREWDRMVEEVSHEGEQLTGTGQARRSHTKAPHPQA